jgi:hypothetical protein
VLDRHQRSAARLAVCGRLARSQAMQMRRLSRLTNAFSKKWESLWAAYCPQFAWHNFCRINMKPRVTPAMEAEIASKPWTMRELLETA